MPRTRHCFAPGCRGGYPGTEKVSLFNVPKDSVEEWSNLVPRSDKQLTTNDALCEKHFHKEDIVRIVVTDTYSYSLKIPRLRSGAKPSFWTNLSNLSKKPATKKRPQSDLSPHTKRKKRTLSAVANEGNEENKNSNDNIETIKIADTKQAWLIMLYNILAKKKVALPEKSWTTKMYDNVITFFDTEQIGNQLVITKQVVVGKSFINFFVLHYLYDRLTEGSTSNKIESLEEFEQKLKYFHKLRICYGLKKLVEDESPNVGELYRKDELTKTIRHPKCNGINLRKLAKYCSLCQRTKEAVLKKMSKGNMSRKGLFINITNDANPRKQTQKLLSRLTQLREHLNVVKQKIQILNEEDVSKKIDEMDNMSLLQKMLVSETLKIVKYSTNLSYSNWLLMCLLLLSKSPKTYQFLRETEILPIPSSIMVRRYFSVVDLKCNIGDEFFERFRLILQEKNEFSRQGILIFEEMAIRVNIKMNVEDLKLVEADLGMSSEDITKGIIRKQADHALVFMWSSLVDNFTQPIAVYATKGSTKGTLAQLLFEVIKKLENCGAEVHGVVCDGVNSSRKMWSKFGISGKLTNTNNKVVHPLDDSRHLYFFSDTSYLIKCLRNQFLQKKSLATPDGEVLWDYYKMIFELDQKQDDDAKICPKITEMHINPDDFMKLRANLATQIFSNSTVTALRIYQKCCDKLRNANSTIRFTKRLNDLFDALNRCRSCERILEGSKDFEILRDSLGFLNAWEIMVLEQQITEEQFLNNSTSEKLRVTITSTLELYEYLLKHRKVQDCSVTVQNIVKYEKK